MDRLLLSIFIVPIFLALIIIVALHIEDNVKGQVFNKGLYLLALLPIVNWGIIIYFFIKGTKKFKEL